MSPSPERPLDGVRLLVLSADPSAIEPLTVALEDAGADVSVRFVDAPFPNAELLDGVVLHDSFGVQHWDALQSFLSRLPAGLPVVDADDSTIERLLDELPVDDSNWTEALPEAGRPPAIRPGGRLLRAAMTVIVVTLLLWLAFRAFAPAVEEPAGSVPATGGTGPSAATGELAGRVTRSDTNGSIGGATVVASGPSGPIATITDSQGRWRFSGLRGGTYVVMSTVARFVAKQVQVEVPEGRAVENVNLSLDPEGP